ncbi:MAG TPA: glycerophosphodiester phosphodiesterase [Desulfobacterales bacterium]|nr:glycerophosphodiester phosphodiesterase [Desulfobacterales bacterium]
MIFDHLPQESLVCAHRGARSIAPENTLLAMKKAMECGAHFWETDVRISKDGELVIFHDDTLGRTTDIATHKDFQRRKDWQVDQFTVRELRQLDAGTWFLTDDPFGTVASGEAGDKKDEAIKCQQIPLLREVLDFTKTHSFPVNLEIKDLKTPPGDTRIVDAIIDMIRETETMDRVLLSSFRHEYLHRAKVISPDITIAVLARKRHPSDLIQYLKSFPANAYHPDKAMYDDKFIVQLKQAGFRVNIWTVNDMEQAQEIFHLGAGVITDWPQRLTGI